jgi:hypothetical protein
MRLPRRPVERRRCTQTCKNLQRECPSSPPFRVSHIRALLPYPNTSTHTHRGNRFLKHCDASRLRSLEDASHVHLFLWSTPALLHHLMSLVAWSDSVKVLTVIYRGTPRELRDIGLVGDLNRLSSTSQTFDAGTEFTKQVRVQMSGRHSYSAYVMCMTDERRERMRRVLPMPEHAASPDAVTTLRLREVAAEMARPDWVDTVDEAIGLHRGRRTRSSGALQQ